MKIASTVIVYNPDIDVIANINTYLPFSDIVYVMDNSTIDLTDEIKSFFDKTSKIKYVSMNGNKGIAKALKDASDLAISDGFDYLLTMDQDSKFPTNDYPIINKYLENSDSDIGILSVNFLKTGGKDKEKIIEQEWVITSGSFLCLEAYKTTKGFDEDLFIDLVDNDICYKLTKNGYKIMQFENIFLDHKLGTRHVEFKLFGKKRLDMDCHSPIRYYYIYRNLNYLSKKYPSQFYKKELKKYNLFKMSIRILLMENKKMQVFKMIRKGKKDAKKGILGKYKGENV